MRFHLLHESRYYLFIRALQNCETKLTTCIATTECLAPTVRTPYYMCGPHDMWSLGVVLINLTCGRNPWKQASFDDPAYRMFAQSRHYLRTVLP